MTNPTTAYAIPLLQASLVLLTLFLGAAHFMIDRNEESTTGELSIVIVGAALLVSSSLSFVLAIVRNSPNEYIRSGAVFLGIVILVISVSAIALVREDVDETGMKFAIKQAILSIILGALFAVGYYTITTLLPPG